MYEKKRKKLSELINELADNNDRFDNVQVVGNHLILYFNNTE